MDYKPYYKVTMDNMQVKKVKIGKSPYYTNMGFWDNVIKELDYLGMTNKSLAEKCGFDASNIGRGIRLGSSPSVETAVKIANVLGVSVEFLVDGNESEQKTPQSLGKKYYKT